MISTTDVGFLRIKNAYTGAISYICHNPLNYQKALDLTGNVLDRTTQQISDNEWVHFDIDRPIRYFEQRNDVILFENLWYDVAQATNVTYNTLKLHILQGYTFDDIAGLIARVAYVDKNYNQVFVANIAYLTEEEVKYEPRPFQIADKVYDRYVEIRFPTLNSLVDIDSQISSATKANDSLFYTNKSFPSLLSSKINIFLYDVSDYETDSEGQLILNTVLPMSDDTNGIFRHELEISDSFSGISAVVQESLNGDYFEMYATYEGEFIEDYLNQRLQQYGETYMIIHDVDVFEQTFDMAGYTEIKTQSFSQIQSSNFDSIFKFRPVVENAHCIAFTIEYTLRLFNQTNPSSIIRRASLTYPNPAKYGRYLEKLDIPVGFQPVRIVNKILNETKTSSLFTNPYTVTSGAKETTQTVTEKNVFLPIQFENVSINSQTLYVSRTIVDTGTDTLTPLVNFELNDLINSDVIFGQGDGIIYINDFDNFIKFKVYRLINKKLEPYVDLVSSDNIKIYLVFEDANGEKIKIQEYSLINSAISASLDKGELLFKIDSLNSQNILNSTNNKFWITVENKNYQLVYGTDSSNEFKDFEVVVYIGTWYNAKDFTSTLDSSYVSKFKLLDDRASQISDQQSQLEDAKTKIKDLQAEINTTSMTESQKTMMDKYIAEIKAIMDYATSSE